MKAWSLYRYWLVCWRCISDIYPLLSLSKESFPWAILAIDFESACSEAGNVVAGGESTITAIDCKYTLWYSASIFQRGKFINGSRSLILPFKHIKQTHIFSSSWTFPFSPEVTPFLFSFSPQTVRSSLPTVCGRAPSRPSAGPRCAGTRRTRASRSACVTSTCRRTLSMWQPPPAPSHRTPSTPSTPTSFHPSWRATSASTTSGDPTSKSSMTKPWPAWSTRGRRGLWFSPAGPFGSTKPFLSKSTSPTPCAQGHCPMGWRPATPAPCAPVTSPTTPNPWSTERSSGPSAEWWCPSRVETSWGLWWIQTGSCTWVTTVLALACRCARTVPSPSGCSSFYTAPSCKFDCWVCWTPFSQTLCIRKQGGRGTSWEREWMAPSLLYDEVQIVVS